MILRARSVLIGYAFARALPLAAIGGTWSFSAAFGRYAGTLAAAVMFMLCLLLIRTRSLEERERKSLPLSRIIPPCVFALLCGLRAANGPAGVIPTLAAGLADSLLVSLLSGFGLAGSAMGALYLPSAAAALIFDVRIPLSMQGTAEVTQAACAAGLAVCSSEQSRQPLSAGGLIFGLVLGLSQNIIL